MKQKEIHASKTKKYKGKMEDAVVEYIKGSAGQFCTRDVCDALGIYSTSGYNTVKMTLDAMNNKGEISAVIGKNRRKYFINEPCEPRQKITFWTKIISGWGREGYEKDRRSFYDAIDYLLKCQPWEKRFTSRALHKWLGISDGSLAAHDELTRSLDWLDRIGYLTKEGDVYIKRRHLMERSPLIWITNA